MYLKSFRTLFQEEIHCDVPSSLHFLNMTYKQLDFPAHPFMRFIGSNVIIPREILYGVYFIFKRVYDISANVCECLDELRHTLICL